LDPCGSTGTTRILQSATHVTFSHQQSQLFRNI
jgi:hypothetical protein